MIREDDPLARDVHADAELAAGLGGEAARAQGLDFTREYQGIGRTLGSLTGAVGVGIAGKAEGVAVSVLRVGVRRSTGRARDVSDELRVLIVVVCRSHSG